MIQKLEEGKSIRMGPLGSNFIEHFFFGHIKEECHHHNPTSENIMSAVLIKSINKANVRFEIVTKSTLLFQKER